MAYNTSDLQKTPSAVSLYGSECNRDDAWDRITNMVNMINTTYANLKQTRDNGELIAGQFYRITDYVTTTTQSDTQSAGNVFDVIVLADSERSLNENARAIQHSDLTTDYFYGQNLNAWKLKYSIDNDTNKFFWADATNGKGVIYEMVDEYNNRCGYDFKNIKMKFYKITATTTTATDLVGTYSASRYAGIANGTLVPNNCTISTSDTEWRYTFDLFTSNTHKDYSLNNYFNNGSRCCYNNKINTLYGRGNSLLDPKQYINVVSFRNVLTSTKYYCYGNKFGDRNFNYSFGDVCYNNTFGNDCYCNTFYDNCQNNTFGHRCFDNTFGNGYQYNRFGNSCINNIFGNWCRSNNLGNGCYLNKFGNSSTDNTFGNECKYHTFGHIFCYNTFGNYCKYNSFGNPNNLQGYKITLAINEHDCGSWVEEEDTESGDTYISGVYDAYLHLIGDPNDTKTYHCAIKVYQDSTVLATLVDEDFTLTDGAKNWDNLSGTWTNVLADDVFLEYKIMYTYRGNTVIVRDTDNW